MQNGFLLESSRNQSTEAPLRPCCGLLEPEEREDIVLALPHIPPAHFPLYLTRCECHVVLSGTFACVAVSGGEVCLFCVTEEKKKTAPCVVCCVIWSLALTVTNTRPSSVAGYVLSDGAACSLCQVIIQPRVSPRFAPLLHHNYFKKKKKRRKKHFRTIFCFNPGMQGGMGKCVGMDWHLYGFLLSFNFENSLLPSQDSVMHVKTQF